MYHKRPLAISILWLSLGRWVSLWPEISWYIKALMEWDRSRNERWSDRLYGDSHATALDKIKELRRYPVWIVRTLLLSIGSSFLAIHYSCDFLWAKWFGIILLAELAFRLLYFLLVILPIGTSGVICTVEDFSDLPEGISNYSINWSSNNEKDPLHQRQWHIHPRPLRVRSLS